VVVTRYSSLAAIVAAVAAPIYALLLTHAGRPTATVLFICVLVLLRHRENFGRLSRGEESRVSIGGK